MDKKICIGSRESRLAVVQTEIVKTYIEKKYPETEVEILTMKTTGDVILDKTLDKVGGKGLFVKELDRALQEKRSDLSVHSLKDMPMETPKELPLLAFSRREDARDVLVLPKGARELKEEGIIGCSSKRRTLQIQEIFPGIKCRPVRGNVLTRLEKLDRGEYDGLILAAAGLKRLGLTHRISRYFQPEEMIPAAGQGILVIQGRDGEDYSYLEDFDDKEARYAAICERAFVKCLDGGCSSPVAAYARVEGEAVKLMGLYYHEESGGYRKGSLEGPCSRAEEIGIRLAKELEREYREMGKVWLVGAGPSDPGLFTRKGEEVLKAADVVVYDALVGQGILAMIPEQAKTIYVGKRSGSHTMKQEEINRTLVREALAGKKVVRLKGGDPFLFGRGGEELELLVEKGIPFEVVPGVTSALAVPAYNGIPVTHRDFCSSLHIVTGHRRGDGDYDIDFNALVQTRGTLVFLMGISALEDICEGLLKGGMDGEMPAAVLQQGTTAAQKKILATVATLPEAVKRRGVETPAIIVVGKVCSLAEKFGWYEKQPLGGKKILVTRPKGLNSSMAARLREKGAEVLELPAVATVPRKDQQELIGVLEHLQDYDWIVFTSPTGVNVFFEELRNQRIDIRRIGKARFAVIGQGTKRTLEEYGILADLMPEEFYGEALGNALAAQCQGGERILVPRAAAGGRELTEILSHIESVQVDDIATYDTVYEKSELVNEREEFEKGAVDYTVFTSASGVEAFARCVEGLDFSKVRGVCIGRRTKEAADALGMVTFMAKKPTMDAVTEKVVELCRNQEQGGE